MNVNGRTFRLPIPLVWAIISLGVLPAVVVANSSAAPGTKAAKPPTVFAMEVDTDRSDGSGLSQAACLQAAASTASKDGYVRIAFNGGQVSAASATGERTLTITCPAAVGDPSYPYAMVSLSDAAWMAKSDRSADEGLQSIVSDLHEGLAQE